MGFNWDKIFLGLAFAGLVLLLAWRRQDIIAAVAPMLENGAEFATDTAPAYIFANAPRVLGFPPPLMGTLPATTIGGNNPAIEAGGGCMGGCF